MIKIYIHRRKITFGRVPCLGVSKIGTDSNPPNAFSVSAVQEEIQICFVVNTLESTALAGSVRGVHEMIRYLFLPIFILHKWPANENYNANVAAFKTLLITAIYS